MRAQDELVSAYLPLVYNIVGRALNGHPDVDDVVQETMLRALGSLGSLNDPGGFRSWLVAITMNQLRHHWRDHRTVQARSGLHDAYDVADPGADFVDLTIVRLGLEGQRREAAEATRWLDPDDQALLSLWWLEAAGELTRAEVAAALELSPQHTAVRVQRMKAQLETARLVVRALSARPRCVLLDDVVAAWDAVPSALWRKRIARHARDCTVCAGFQSGLVPAEGLLVGLGLVPVGAGLLGAAGLLTGLGAGTADATPLSFTGDAAGGPGAVPDGPGAAFGPGDPGETSAGVMDPAGWREPGPAPTERHGAPTDPGTAPGDPASGGPMSGGTAFGDPAFEVTASGGAGAAPAGSPATTLGPAAGADRRTSRRARGRDRRRRGRTVAAVAAVLLVTGGTISGIAVLTPDGEGDTVRPASAGGSQSAVPTPAASSPATTSSSSPSSSPSATASADASRKPRSPATPRPDESEAKSSPARTPAPAKTSARPQEAQPSAPAAPAAGGPAAQVLALTNTERSKAGCGPVTLDDRLARAAQLHSEDMSANGYFSHTGQNGSSFADRAKAQGHPSPGAENIARGQNSAASVMQAWMDSPGHRANILNCSLKTLGVGVVTSDWTWTQVFGY
ncbi:sigma-70 family RNA polymerase sigma factor [Streptomyces sp. Tu 3180]|uniref:sigma-70 family RNA polymerase sigma factor n=1 Tax=Streptomyces sp. Tu 3180 TaxID=2682611 RepID=UPI00135A6D23|nr:sigma-70 family RNA polymerase sigma factor [Streptomyces sp. Tu 3180]KAF3469718.1 sigma-70 family RNA polymerase sigma factor [Streptomyces sp. Tu 3180]